MNPLGEALGNSSNSRACSTQGPFLKTDAIAAEDFARIARSVADKSSDAPADSLERGSNGASGTGAALPPPLFPFGAILALPGEGEGAPATTGETAGVDAARGRDVALDVGKDVIRRPPLSKSDRAAPFERICAAAEIPPAVAPSAPRGENSNERIAGFRVTGDTERNPASNERMNIRFGDIGVHIPLAIGRSLDAVASTESDGSASLGRQGGFKAAPHREALKILTFEVEPATLGAISVRMKVTQSRIEIRMEAQSDVAPVLLQAREALSTAIGDKGLILDSYEVGVLPPTPPIVAASDPSVESGGSFNGGFAHDGRSSRQERQDGQERAARPRDDAPSSFAPVGLVL